MRREVTGAAFAATGSLALAATYAHRPARDSTRAAIDGCCRGRPGAGAECASQSLSIFLDDVAKKSGKLVTMKPVRDAAPMALSPLHTPLKGSRANARASSGGVDSRILTALSSGSPREPRFHSHGVGATRALPRDREFRHPGRGLPRVPQVRWTRTHRSVERTSARETIQVRSAQRLRARQRRRVLFEGAQRGRRHQRQIDARRVVDPQDCSRGDGRGERRRDP